MVSAEGVYQELGRLGGWARERLLGGYQAEVRQEQKLWGAAAQLAMCRLCLKSDGRNLENFHLKDHVKR